MPQLWTQFLKEKNNVTYFMLLSMFLGVASQVMKVQLTPDPPSPNQTSLSEWKPQNRTNTHKLPPPHHHNLIGTMTPTLLMKSTATKNKIRVPHSRKEIEPMSHDDSACCVARCLFRCSLKL